MNPIIDSALQAVIGLSRRKRRFLLATIDLLLLLYIVWLLLTIRYWNLYVPQSVQTAALMILGPLLSVGVFLAFRVYHIVARYLGVHGSLRLAACMAISAALWSAILLNVGQYGIPRSVVLAYVPAGTAAVVLIRLLAANLLSLIGIELRRPWGQSQAMVPVLIYGTGQHAVQLGKVTRRSKTRKLIGYIDSSGTMSGRYIGQHKVYRFDKITSLILAHGVEEIYVAEPQQSPAERRELLGKLEQFKLRVRLLPDLESIALGRISLNNLRGLKGRDLLGREEVPADPLIVARAIEGKCVMVTGAGGSIGSQLALNALHYKPRRVVLFEQSELAIHNIERECSSVISQLTLQPEIIKVLGSVGDVSLISDVLRAHEVDVIFHAAAYKHVPIVEDHPLAGISNNVLATERLARTSMDFGIERFVLISSDKAVRPTNVMGATKRVAELIIQALDTKGSNTVFTSVRFGNVLESSGSVFGIFEAQIRAGGPITVTDPNVLRYFMSLGEACNLVLQAASMAEGGETFVLDMGEPVKIDSLARSMIRLMGYEERTEGNPEGDIEINYIGLRPGEKLVEELVLSEHSITGTQHPRIWKAQEPSVEVEALQRAVAALKSAVGIRSVPLALASLESIVEGYCARPVSRTELQPSCNMVSLH